MLSKLSKIRFNPDQHRSKLRPLIYTNIRELRSNLPEVATYAQHESLDIFFMSEILMKTPGESEGTQ